MVSQEKSTAQDEKLRTYNDFLTDEKGLILSKYGKLIERLLRTNLEVSKIDASDLLVYIHKSVLHCDLLYSQY
jgi:hypothetical protein